MGGTGACCVSRSLPGSGLGKGFLPFSGASPGCVGVGSSVPSVGAQENFPSHGAA